MKKAEYPKQERSEGTLREMSVIKGLNEENMKMKIAMSKELFDMGLKRKDVKKIVGLNDDDIQLVIEDYRNES